MVYAEAATGVEVTISTTNICISLKPIKYAIEVAITGTIISLAAMPEIIYLKFDLRDENLRDAPNIIRAKTVVPDDTF